MSQTPTYEAVKREQGFDPALMESGTHQTFMDEHQHEEWLAKLLHQNEEK